MVFSHVIWGHPGGLFQFSGGGAIRIIASASSSICAMCPNMERRRGWIIAARLGCVVILLIANKLVPFDSKQCSQAPLINNIKSHMVNSDS